MKPEGDPMDAPKAQPATPPPTTAKPQRAPRPPRPEAPDDEETNSDFSRLKFLFDKVRIAPKTGMVTAMQPKANRLRGELTTDYEHEMAGEVERLKDEFATARGHANFKSDISAGTAKKFAIQMMGTILKLIMPDADMSGSARTTDARMLGRAMGQEGEGDWGQLKKIVGKSRIPLPPRMVSNLRNTVIALKNKYAQDYHIDDWREDMPQVKEFALDMLAAVLKAVFPAEQASGGGKTTNVNKVASYLDKMRGQPRPPEQTMEPPANLEA